MEGKERLWGGVSLIQPNTTLPPQFSSLPKGAGRILSWRILSGARLGAVHRLTQHADTLQGTSWWRKKHRRKAGYMRGKQLSGKKSVSNHKWHLAFAKEAATDRRSQLVWLTNNKSNPVSCSLSSICKHRWSYPQMQVQITLVFQSSAWGLWGWASEQLLDGVRDKRGRCLCVLITPHPCKLQGDSLWGGDSSDEEGRLRWRWWLMEGEWGPESYQKNKKNHRE